MKLLPFLLLLIVFPASSQLRPEIRQLVREISKNGQLEGEYVGRGFPSRNYARFEALCEKATTKELLKLAYHKNAAVRGYTAMALAERNDPAVCDAMKRFLQGDERAETFRGCFLGSKLLASELYFWISIHLSETDSADLQTLNLLNGVLLNSRPDNTAEEYLVWRALENNRAYPAHYKRVRELAEKDVYLALEALAAYRKPEDIPFILQQEEAFCAIANFPDPAFRELVRSHAAKDSSACYLKAVASYKDPEAVTVLTHFRYSGAKQPDLLVRALSERYDPIFDSLVADTWLDRGTISPELIGYLSADSIAAAKTFAAGLLANDTIRIIGGQNYLDQDRAVVPMLRVISRHAPESLPDICAQRIADADHFEFKFYLEYVMTTRSESMFAPMKAFIERNALPGNIHGIAGAFLALNDPEMTERMADLVRTQHEKWDQSGWSDEIYSLFEGYGIRLQQ